MSMNDASADSGDSFFATQNGLLQDFDTFVSDSENFIQQFYVHQKKQPVTVASKLAFWSNRKLGSRLQKILNSLSKREEFFDAHLRGKRCFHPQNHGTNPCSAKTLSANSPPSCTSPKNPAYKLSIFPNASPP